MFCHIALILVHNLKILKLTLLDKTVGFRKLPVVLLLRRHSGHLHVAPGSLSSDVKKNLSFSVSQDVKTFAKLS